MLNIDIIELSTSCVIILSKGRAKFSETKIIIFKEKVKRVKWYEGEAFCMQEIMEKNIFEQNKELEEIKKEHFSNVICLLSNIWCG